MTILEQKLKQYAENCLNVLLIGSHGIGKTTITKNIANQLNLKFKYYSASTLDPFADIVGVPVPNKEEKYLEFFRSKELEEAEFVMFDELNRAHPRVLNAVLEIIQFKSINGTKLPNLKMIWAAINPPGENYQVEELDPALTDRFHCFVKMNPELNLEYLSSVMEPQVADILKTWWDTSLDDNQRKIFTPRRVEYVGVMISKDLPWKDSIPQGHPFPIDQLSQKIRKLKANVPLADGELEVSKENILSNPEYFIKKAKEDPRMFMALDPYIRKFAELEIYPIKDLLEAFPIDLLTAMFGKKFSAQKRLTKEDFEKNGCDFSKYPKIVKAYGWVF